MEESGMLASIIGITNTHQVGLVRDALVEYSINNGYALRWVLPVVAETYDGFLNDIDAFHLNKEHVFQAIASASSTVPAEGGVGGGTGMLCHDFKGGIGTSSRLVETKSGQFTVGALVQANYGTRCHDFKGGIGTSSRLVETKSGQFTVGALVQANTAPALTCALMACQSD